MNRGVGWGLVFRTVAALVVVGLAVTAFLVRQRASTLDERETAGEDAVRAARSGVETLLTYSAGTLVRDLDEERRLLTDDFAEDYGAMVRREVLPTARQFEVTNELKVVSAGVVSAREDKATVLLFVNQITRSKTKPQGITQGGRVEVTVERHGKKWLISDVHPV